MKKRIARRLLSMLLTLTMVAGFFAGIPPTVMAEEVPGSTPDLGFGLQTRQVFEGNSVSGIVPNNSQIQLEVDETSSFEPEVVLEQSLMNLNISPEEDFEFDEATGTITRYVGEGGAVVIPETIGGVAVTIIGDDAFSDCYDLTSIDIPSSVTSIGNVAFNGCEGLTSITIPNSVSSIGDGVFSGCDNLTIYGEDNSYAKTYAEVNNIAFSIISGGSGGGASPSASPVIIKQPEGKTVALGSSITLTIEAESIDGGTLTYRWIKDGVDIPGAASTSYTINSAASTDEGSYRVIVTNRMSGSSPAIVASDVAVLTVVVDASPEEDFEFDEATGTITGYYGSGGAVVIPETIGGVAVTAIGEEAFSYCYDLTSINIPNSVTSIGEWAFQNCSSLTSIAIQSSVTSIGRSAFENCESLTSIEIPSSVTSIGYAAFWRCDSLQEINVDEANNNYSSLDGVLFNKTKTEIVKYPGNKVGTHYAIPSSVTSIGEWAFHYCESLISIAIPSSVTSISDHAFYECLSLTSITIPSSVTIIGDETFYGDEVFLGCDNLTIYGENDSYAQTYAEKYSLPFTIISGGSSALPVIIKQPERKTVLEGSSITLTVEAESTDGGTLTYQWKKDGVDIPGATSTSYTINSTVLTDEGSYRVIVTNTVSGSAPTTVASNVAVITVVVDAPGFEFDRATGTITGYTGSGGAVVIPETIGGVAVTAIGEDAFEYCDSLTSITIPSSVTSIGEGAFDLCVSLQEINVYEANNDYSSLDGVLFNEAKTELMKYPSNKVGTQYTIPSSVTSIGERAFQNCSSLTSIAIQSSVTSIGSGAFENCESLTSIEIPSSVTSISADAFFNCVSLQEMNVDEANNNYSSLDGVLFNKAKTELRRYPSNKVGTQYAIPSSVISIGEWAFERCASLTNIVIPSSVTSISDYAFYECSSLTSISIPSSVTTIGDETFYGDEVFSGCDNLTIYGENNSYAQTYAVKYSIPFTIISGESSALPLIIKQPESKTVEEGSSIILTVQAESTDGGILTYQWKKDGVDISGAVSTSYTINSTALTDEGSYSVNVTNTMLGSTPATVASNVAVITVVVDAPDFEFDRATGTITGYTGSGGAVVIPETIGGVAVTAIGEDAFRYCDSLTSIEIPSSVTSIGYGAFYCSGLTSITIPGNVTSIGKFAFWGCDSLTSISIPSSITSIGDYAFDYCENLQEINVDEDNNNYSSLDGVLFNETKTEIMKYPGNKVGTEYAIPNSVIGIGDRAFENCISLKSINIPEGVTSIGEDAFEYCDSLTSIEIPSSVTSIGYSAFYNCRSLTSINISEGITSIGDYAFSGCKSLTIINIPEGVTSIGDQTFEGCYSLTSINIPSSVTNIDFWAFYDCLNLTSITIPSSVISIGSGTFENCLSLTSIKIPSSVTSIGDGAFSGCDSLQEINVDEDNNNYSSLDGVLFNKTKTELMKYPDNKVGTEYAIPSSVTDIGDGAFENCASLTSITIPSSVTSIGSKGFKGCDSLTSINIPSNVTSIGNGAFGYCDSLQEINVDEDNNNYSSLDGVLFNEAKTEIVKYPDNKVGTEYIIPSSVTSIGGYAFRDCWSLTSITIPSSVTSIGYSSFYGCDNLTIRGEDNSYAQTYADENSIPFSDVSGLTSAFPVINKHPQSITMAEGSSITLTVEAESTDGGTLTYQWKKDGFNIPGATGTSYAINSAASSDEGNYRVIVTNTMSGSTPATVASNVAVLALVADAAPEEHFEFDETTGTITGYNGEDGEGGAGGALVIPETIGGIPVTKIGDYAFIFTYLTSIDIPSSVTSIGDYAFYECWSLTSINVPSSVTSIGKGVFYYSGLTSINIPGSVTSIGSKAFWGCRSLTSINVSEGVNSIRDYAFRGCENLTSITIPSSVTSIGEGAFWGCRSLTSINIPSSVTSIGEGVFSGSDNLTIYGEDNSYAQTYAEVNNIPFSIISGGIPVYGDVNGDDSISSSDHQRLFEHLNGANPLTGDALTVGDVNGDGSISSSDHQRLFEHLNGTNPLN